jgi:uncharacterized protein
MRFWDSSALVPLVLAETTSGSVLAEYEADPAVVAWWASPVECASAVCRLEREGQLASEDATAALTRLQRLTRSWHTVEAVERVRTLSLRLLRVHPLRAADALQLAAAHLASEDHPSTLTLVTLDDRLALAAEREGFPVVQPGRARTA